jgi:Protein of unknown function (DUF3105)
MRPTVHEEQTTYMATGKGAGTAPQGSKGAKPGSPKGGSAKPGPTKAKGLTPKVREEQSRTERVNALRAAERKRERRQIVIISLAGVVSVGLIVGLVGFFYANRPGPATAPNGVTDYRVAGATDQWGGIAHTHVTTPVTYPQSPPVGGNHNPVWQNCGVYNAPIANENGVHSLEHGTVWITYQPSLPASQLATIKKDVAGLSFTLVSPYPNDPAPVVASAWGAQLKLQSASDPGLKEFIKFYRLNADRTPELGAACSGGTGTPTG